MSAEVISNFFVHSLLRAHDWQHRPQLDEVCQWWRSGGRGVLALVGMGGAGKTAIVERFLRVLPGGLPSDPDVPKDGSLPTPHSVFVFSFYDAPNPEAFFEALQMWLENTPRVQTVLSIGQMFYLLQQTPGLMVLDGLEKVQEDGVRGLLGRLASPKLREFLDRIAAGYFPQLSVLVTSRFPLADLRDAHPQFFRLLPIEEIDLPAGVRLLRARGVKGTNLQLEGIVEACGRHALTVDFAGGYIAEFGGGDPTTPVDFEMDSERLRQRLDDEPDEARRRVLKQGHRFARLAERYREAMRGGAAGRGDTANQRDGDAAALALLERICLFRLGVEAETLANIFTGEKAVNVSGPALAGLSGAQLQKKLDWLVRMRIVESQSLTRNPKSKIRYSIHPAVRDGFLSGIGDAALRENHEAVRQGLEVSLGDAPGENPSDPATLDLLEEIVHHTLQSGHVNEAWDIYQNRIGGGQNLIWRLGAYERGERICRAFAGGRGIGVQPVSAPPSDRQAADATALPWQSLPEANQASFINEWALYLQNLGRLAAAARCNELCIEMAMRQKYWKNASIDNQNLSEVWLLSGRLTAGQGTAAEALRLAELADDAEERRDSHAYRVHAHALRGEVPSALADFRAALDWQHKADGDDNRPLHSNRGYWHTHLLTRLGRRDEATRLTDANRSICEKHFSAGEPSGPKCNLILSNLHCEAGNLAQAETLHASAHDWAVARNAKEVRCWAALVDVRIAACGRRNRHATPSSLPPSTIPNPPAALADGLALARDCGYGIYHIDLLLERARWHLFGGAPQAALDDLRTALDDGVPGNPQTGQPELLAATHAECGYAWGIAEGLQLRGEALLLQAAQTHGQSTFAPAQRATLPAAVRDLIAQAEACLTEALARWQPLHDPEPERPDQNFQLDGKQYNYRAAETHRVLTDLANGILSRQPIRQVTQADNQSEKPMETKRTVLTDSIGLVGVANHSNPNRVADLIFVHGLGGGSQTTWAHEARPEHFWPDWIAAEFQNLGVWTLGYATTVSAWNEQSMPLADLGHSILDNLVNEEIGERPLIFITHSMGGLATKQILNHARTQGVKRYRKIADATRGVAFIATPHSGAKLANFVEWVGIVLNASDQISELKQHDARLRELHQAFLTTVNEKQLICRSYAERLQVRPGVTVFGFNIKVPKGMMVVDPTSAEPHIAGEAGIPLDEDHISICKPKDRSAQIHKSIRTFLRECLEAAPTP